MKTTNWQAKALTLFIAVAALWLATACDGNADISSEASLTQITTETLPVATSEPSVGCTQETPGLRSRLNTTKEEYQEHQEKSLMATRTHIKFAPLFWRQPNTYDVSEEFLRDAKGGRTDEWGIIIWVTEKVDQSTLPHDDRIPGYLDGVPIQIEVAKAAAIPNASSCDYSTCANNWKKGEESMTNPSQDRLDRIHEIRLKYDPLFWRQPTVHGVGEGQFKNENGQWIETIGIVVSVTNKVDQSTLPPEDRIPDCLEGIPVQVIEEAIPNISIG